MTFLDCLSLPKLYITRNQSGGKMIKFQQSQALTSHFESFWSIVQKQNGDLNTECRIRHRMTNITSSGLTKLVLISNIVVATIQDLACTMSSDIQNPRKIYLKIVKQAHIPIRHFQIQLLKVVSHSCLKFLYIRPSLVYIVSLVLEKGGWVLINVIFSQMKMSSTY